MNFLVDANLPPGLAAWLRERGHEASHVYDAPGHTERDISIFQFAKLQGLVVVTKDEDFAVLATLEQDPTPVVWLRLGNATNAALRRWLEPLLPEIVRRIEGGEKLIEVV